MLCLYENRFLHSMKQETDQRICTEHKKDTCSKGTKRQSHDQLTCCLFYPFGFPFSLKHCNHNGTAGRNGIVDGIYHHIERSDQTNGRYRLLTGGADHRSCQYTDTENEKRIHDQRHQHRNDLTSCKNRASKFFVQNFRQHECAPFCRFLCGTLRGSAPREYKLRPARHFSRAIRVERFLSYGNEVSYTIRKPGAKFPVKHRAFLYVILSEPPKKTSTEFYINP